MKPIRHIDDVPLHSVLYHSAFGFARVVEVADHQVRLEWERHGENLPEQVSVNNLRRVYALCPRGGFFDRALNDTEALQELLQVDPPTALAALLEDLEGPQRLQDLEDWVVGRRLMSHEAFDRWWETLQPLLHEDTRFHFDAEAMTLQRQAESRRPEDRLANPLLSPARRLDIALAHRSDLGEADFSEHALVAWRYGGSQVRDLAMAALADSPPDPILRGLVGSGPESIEALIHALRHGKWSPGAVSSATHSVLLDRVLQATADGGPLDAEGRLAATLYRWGAQRVVPALADQAEDPDGRRLIRAALDALPPRRAFTLGLELLTSAVEADRLSDSSQWLADELLARRASSPEEMAQDLLSEHPDLSSWFRVEYSPPTVGEPADTELAEDESFHTVEIELDAVPQPTSISAVPARSGRAFLGLGLSLARSLAQQHNAGRIVNPTRDSVRLRPDGILEVGLSGDAARSPRPLTEAPTQPGDVYAAAVLLVELLLGRAWPRNVPASRVTPYLRHLVHDLPASALAPVDAALHPLPSARPKSGMDWLVLWQAAAAAEDARANAGHQAQAVLRAGYDSHVGHTKLLTTQTNQDALLVSHRASNSLLLVCDGISTANAGSGDVAASITTQVVGSLWEQALPRIQKADTAECRDFLDRALRMANQAVCEAALRYAGGNLEGRVPMGTTAIAAMSQGNLLHIATLGDSRAYLIGRYGVALISADQNQARERLREWFAGNNPYWDPNAFALVGYVGHFNEWSRPEPLPADHFTLRLLPGERLVLCTDGVTDYIGHTHPEVCANLADGVRDRLVDEAAREMVARANRGGGGDNTSIVVVSLL